MQGQQNPTNGGGLAVAGFLLFFMVVAWWVLHDEIVGFVLSLYRYVFVAANALFGWHSTYSSDHIVLIDAVLANPKLLNFKGMMQIMSHGGEYLRWLVVPPMLWMAFRVWQNPIRNYTEIMTVKRFLARQSATWKPVVPVLHLDLISGSPKGWRSPFTAPEIMRKLKLTFGRAVNIDRTRQYFESHLGPMIKLDDLSPLKPHEKALFAVFALRIVRDRTGKALTAQILLDDMNESARGTGVPNFSLALPHFERLKAHKDVVAAIRPHAYVRTVLVQMLCAGRKFDGVLPPSQFIWLRPLDPVLFYALNRAPVVPERLHTPSFAEAAGVLNHWQAERIAFMTNRRMTKPFVAGALIGFSEDLEHCGLLPLKYVETSLLGEMAGMKLISPRLRKDAGDGRARRPANARMGGGSGV
jgi:intracellular multiplication protein IcmP